MKATLAKRGLLAALAALLAQVRLAGAPATGEPEFKGTGLCQFALHGFVLTPQSEASINQAVEQLIARHESAFGFKRAPEFRLKMRVYGRFEDFTNSPAMRGQTNLQGVYVARTKEIVTYRREIPGYLGTTLLHEASHAILDYHYRRIQTWLSEGAAEYFALILARNALATNLLQQRSARLNLWLREGKLPSLEGLLNAGTEEWKEIPQAQAYAVSWSVFQFLMSTENNRRIMNTILKEWQGYRHRDPDCVGQVERLYPGGWKGFETAWRRWIDPTGAAERFKASFSGGGLCQFAVHGYNLSPALEASINQNAQDLLEKHRAFFGLAPNPAFHLHIRLFGEAADYMRFSTNWRVMGAEIKAEELAHSEGYYSPLSREIVTVATKSAEELTPRLLHLANTVFLEENFRRVPSWVTLGSDYYFLSKAQSSAGRGEALDATWQKLGMQNVRLPPVRSIMDEPSRARESQNIDSSRQTAVLSWALFQFFAAPEPNRRALTNMLKSPPEGPSSASESVTWMGRHYPGGMARLEAEFRQWAGRLGQ